MRRLGTYNSDAVAADLRESFKPQTLVAMHFLVVFTIRIFDAVCIIIFERMSVHTALM